MATPDRKRERLHEIIFEADTPAGRTFDVALLWAILVSVLVVMLDSVGEIHRRFGDWLLIIEWMLTGLFTVEYLLRLWSVRKPIYYARSFFGLVDLLSILPSYLSLFVTGAQMLIVIRALRLLRVFRVLKLAQLLGEATVLSTALRASRSKILVFVGTVMIAVTIIGTLMYVIEGPRYGFTSIPRAIYWAIVTVTTVGYGDLYPQTPAGQVLAALAMIMGYGIIAVPTGIVSVEIAAASRKHTSLRACLACAREEHDPEARFCKYCGTALERPHAPG